MALNKFFL